jgi:hypothetical protein
MGLGEKLHIQSIPDCAFLNYSETHIKKSWCGNKTRSYKFQGGCKATLKRRLLLNFNQQLNASIGNSSTYNYRPIQQIAYSALSPEWVNTSLHLRIVGLSNCLYYNNTDPRLVKVIGTHPDIIWTDYELTHITDYIMIAPCSTKLG